MLAAPHPPDRDAGALGAVPAPPPRGGSFTGALGAVEPEPSPAGRALSRASSTASVGSHGSVPRSSSFTRSRKFARGDELSLADARHILDSASTSYAGHLKFAAAQLILAEHLPSAPPRDPADIPTPPSPPHMPENEMRPPATLRQPGPMPKRTPIPLIAARKPKRPANPPPPKVEKGGTFNILVPAAENVAEVIEEDDEPKKGGAFGRMLSRAKSGKFIKTPSSATLPDAEGEKEGEEEKPKRKGVRFDDRNADIHINIDTTKPAAPSKAPPSPKPVEPTVESGFDKLRSRTSLPTFASPPSRSTDGETPSPGPRRLLRARTFFGNARGSMRSATSPDVTADATAPPAAAGTSLDEEEPEPLAPKPRVGLAGARATFSAPFGKRGSVATAPAAGKPDGDPETRPGRADSTTTGVPRAGSTSKMRAFFNAAAAPRFTVEREADASVRRASSTVLPTANEAAVRRASSAVVPGKADRAAADRAAADPAPPRRFARPHSRNASADSLPNPDGREPSAIQKSFAKAQAASASFVARARKIPRGATIARMQGAFGRAQASPAEDAPEERKEDRVEDKDGEQVMGVVPTPVKPDVQAKEADTVKPEKAVAPAPRKKSADASTKKATPVKLAKPKGGIVSSPKKESKAKPLVEKSKPVLEETMPVVEKAKAVVEKPKAVVGKVQAVVERPEPVVEKAKPFVEKTKPVVEKAKPVVETAKPVVENTKPIVENAKLAAVAAAPVVAERAVNVSPAPEKEMRSEKARTSIVQRAKDVFSGHAKTADPVKKSKGKSAQKPKGGVVAVSKEELDKTKIPAASSPKEDDKRAEKKPVAAAEKGMAAIAPSGKADSGAENTEARAPDGKPKTILTPSTKEEARMEKTEEDNDDEVGSTRVLKTSSSFKRLIQNLESAVKSTGTNVGPKKPIRSQSQKVMEKAPAPGANEAAEKAVEKVSGSRSSLPEKKTVIAAAEKSAPEPSVPPKPAAAEGSTTVQKDRSTTGGVIDTPAGRKVDSAENVVKAPMTEARAKSDFGATTVNLPEFVTIKRVIRRVKPDGSEEIIVRRVKERPAAIRPNGDVVVHRTVTRPKKDGSGETEQVVIEKVIPRRSAGAQNIDRGVDAIAGGIGSRSFVTSKSGPVSGQSTPTSERLSTSGSTDNISYTARRNATEAAQGVSAAANKLQDEDWETRYKSLKASQSSAEKLVQGEMKVSDKRVEDRNEEVPPGSFGMMQQGLPRGSSFKGQEPHMHEQKERLVRMPGASTFTNLSGLPIESTSRSGSSFTGKSGVRKKADREASPPAPEAARVTEAGAKEAETKKAEGKKTPVRSDSRNERNERADRGTRRWPKMSTTGHRRSSLSRVMSFDTRRSQSDFDQTPADEAGGTSPDNRPGRLPKSSSVGGELPRRRAEPVPPVGERSKVRSKFAGMLSSIRNRLQGSGNAPAPTMAA